MDGVQNVLVLSWWCTKSLSTSHSYWYQIFKFLHWGTNKGNISFWALSDSLTPILTKWHQQSQWGAQGLRSQVLVCCSPWKYLCAQVKHNWSVTLVTKQLLYLYYDYVSNTETYATWKVFHIFLTPQHDWQFSHEHERESSSLIFTLQPLLIKCIIYLDVLHGGAAPPSTLWRAVVVVPYSLLPGTVIYLPCGIKTMTDIVTKNK